jgi:hypothetical protein
MRSDLLEYGIIFGEKNDLTLTSRNLTFIQKVITLHCRHFFIIQTHKTYYSLATLFNKEHAFSNDMYFNEILLK